VGGIEDGRGTLQGVGTTSVICAAIQAEQVAVRGETALVITAALLEFVSCITLVVGLVLPNVTALAAVWNTIWASREADGHRHVR
jgi:hypothetical protein